MSLCLQAVSSFATACQTGGNENQTPAHGTRS